MSGKQFLYIIIATLITVLVWAGVDLYHSRNKVEISPELQQIMEPVNPNFDQNLINDL
jgi:hypothetical protein